MVHAVNTVGAKWRLERYVSHALADLVSFVLSAVTNRRVRSNMLPLCRGRPPWPPQLDAERQPQGDGTLTFYGSPCGRLQVEEPAAMPDVGSRPRRSRPSVRWAGAVRERVRIGDAGGNALQRRDHTPSDGARFRPGSVTIVGNRGSASIARSTNHCVTASGCRPTRRWLHSRRLPGVRRRGAGRPAQPTSHACGTTGAGTIISR